MGDGGFESMTEHKWLRDVADAANAIKTNPHVVDVECTYVDGDARLDITLIPELESVPPGVLRLLARHDLHVRHLERQGLPTHILVVCG